MLVEMETQPKKKKKKLAKVFPTSKKNDVENH